MSAQIRQRGVASTFRVSSDQRDKTTEFLEIPESLLLKLVLDDKLGFLCDIPWKISAMAS